MYQENEGNTSKLLCCIEIKENPLKEFEKRVVETGFRINILLLTLQYMHPLKCKAKLGNFGENLSELYKLEKMNSYKREIVRCCSANKKVADADKLNIAEAQDFYYSNISTVEINNRDKLVKLFFRVPFKCRFLTKKSQRELITKVNRTSQQGKIEDFCNKSKIYEVEMRHQQGIARYPLIDFIIGN